MELLLPVSCPRVGWKEQAYMAEALANGHLSWVGAFVGRFEDDIKVQTSAAHALVCSSGTAALHLALLALGVGPGDDVYVPALSYIATANAVTYTGARPVFVDVDETWCIDPLLVHEAVINSVQEGRRPRAVIAVHLYGAVADMDALREMVKPFDVAIVEDAAEAHGATYRGDASRQREVGTLGDIAAFSFFGNKIIATGEGGAVTTMREDLAERVYLYRGQGQIRGRRFEHSVVGYNYRMTNLQAAVGCAQMERLGEELQHRQQISEWYREALPGVTFQPEQVGRVWWLVSIEVDKRDMLAGHLSEAGIETRPVFPALTDQTPYARWTPPVTRRLSDRGLSLPTHWKITKEDVQRVADAIQSFPS